MRQPFDRSVHRVHPYQDECALCEYERHARPGIDDQTDWGEFIRQIAPGVLVLLGLTVLVIVAQLFGADV